MKRVKLIFSVLLLLGISLILSGCQGGGCSNPATTTSSTTTTITGTVYVPSQYDGQVVVASTKGPWERFLAMVSPRAAAGTGDIPLKQAKVTIINFADGIAYSNITATTDDNGRYTLSGVPNGVDVVVVVIAELNTGGQIRLTRVLADTSGPVTADVDSGSSLASESLGLLLAKGRNLTREEVATEMVASHDAAEAMKAENVSIDLKVGGELLKVKFGDGIVLDQNKPDYYKFIVVVVGSLPSDVAGITDEVRARAFIHDLRNTGVALTAPVNQKMMAIGAADEDRSLLWQWGSEASDKGTFLLEFYHYFITQDPYGAGNFTTTGSGYWSGSDEFYSVDQAELAANAAPKSLNGAWEIVVTGTGVSEVWIISKTGTNLYSFQASGTTTASGTFAISEGVPQDSPDNIALIVDLSIDQITDPLITDVASVKTSISMEFNLYGWSGSWGDVDYFSCARFEKTVTTTNLPESLVIGSTVTVTSDETIVFKKLTNASYTNYCPITITQSGSDSYYVLDSNGSPNPVLKTENMTATYTLNDGTSFDGTFASDLSNYQTYGSLNWKPLGTASYNGNLSIPGQQTLGVKLTASTSAADSYNLGFDYTRDGVTLAITGTVVIDKTNNLTTVDLTNPYGILLHAKVDNTNENILEASIMKGNTPLASVTTSGTIVRIDYTDGYSESL